MGLENWDGLGFRVLAFRVLGFRVWGTVAITKGIRWNKEELYLDPKFQSSPSHL